jgi:hypothetical protein
MNVLYDKGREGILDRTIDMTGDVRAMLLKSAYAFNAAHDFLDDLVANDNGRSAALSGKSYAAGVFDAADTTLSALAADPSNAIALYQHTGNNATARVIAYLDGRFQIEITANAASGATALVPEDLPADIASGAVLTKISGTGPTTIATSAAASAGARSLTVAALGSAVAAGAVYEYTAASFTAPFTPAPSQPISVVWDNGPSKIFKL